MKYKKGDLIKLIYNDNENDWFIIRFTKFTNKYYNGVKEIRGRIILNSDKTSDLKSSDRDIDFSLYSTHRRITFDEYLMEML